MKFENITASTMNIKLIPSFWYNEGYFLERKKLSVGSSDVWQESVFYLETTPPLLPLLILDFFR